MPRSKPKPTPGARVARSTPQVVNGLPDEVLTLDEAAVYLRLAEADVLRLVREQDLPARQVGTDWRFYKRAVQEWLSRPPLQANKEGIWAYAGAWKDDPYAEEMLERIWSERGQPVPKD